MFRGLEPGSGPVWLNDASSGRHCRQLTTVQATEPILDVVERALTRPHGQRWDPIVCIDTEGHPLGVVPMERLVGAATQQARRNP